MKPTNLEITAVSKTLYIFDYQLAKVSIPVNLNKLDDKREWYYLKNAKDENIIGILTSIYCELKTEKSILIEKSPNINANNSCIIPNSNQIISNKNDLSYDMYKNNSNNYFSNVINKANTYGNNHITNNINNYSTEQTGKEILNKKRIKNNSEDKNLDNTVEYNENCRSPDISYVNNNLLSPYSYRLENEKTNMNYNMLNMTNLNTKLNNSIINFNYNTNKHNLTSDNIHNFKPDFNYLNTGDSFLDCKLNDEKVSIEQAEMIKKIKQKVNKINDEQERLKIMNEEIVKNQESKIFINLNFRTKE